MKVNQRPVEVAQKEPEDFSADEKEAAHAKISDARIAEVAAAKKTLETAIVTNTETQENDVATYKENMSK
jgi:hypothetical protein